jgi:hypothetical protein
VAAGESGAEDEFRSEVVESAPTEDESSQREKEGGGIIRPCIVSEVGQERNLVVWPRAPRRSNKWRKEEGRGSRR